MAIMLPEPLAKIFGAVSGMSWPEANEDELREAWHLYQQFADDIPQLTEYIVELVNVCLTKFQGEAADAFVASMRDLIGQDGGDDYLQQAQQQAQQLADIAQDTANQVEYAKWMIIAQLVMLAAQIAFAIAWAPFTFGATLPELGAVFALVREAIQELFVWLLKSIAMHAVVGIAGGVLMNTVIQGIQIADGNRTSWDGSSLLQAVEFGAISGVLSGPMDLIGGYLGDALGGLLGKSAGDLLGEELGTAFDTLGVDAAKDDVEQDLATVIADEAETSVLENEFENLPEEEFEDLIEKLPTESTEETLAEETEDLTHTQVEDDPVEDDATVVDTESAEAMDDVDSAVDDAPLEPEAANPADEGALEGTWLEKAASQAFAKDIGKLFGQIGNKLDQGFAKFGAGTIAEHFENEMADVFGKHLGDLLGEDAAKDLGHDFAATFARTWGAKGAHDKDMFTALRDVLDGSGLDKDASSVLSDELPLLAGAMKHEGNLFFHLGHVIVDQVRGGVDNMLTQGFYDLIFDDSHTFTLSWSAFLGGMASGVLGVLGHTLLKPISDRWSSFVNNARSYPMGPDDSPFLSLAHPLTLLSLLSNLSGFPAPFPVPRTGAHLPDPVEQVKLGEHWANFFGAHKIFHPNGGRLRIVPSDPGSDPRSTLQSVFDSLFGRGSDKSPLSPAGIDSRTFDFDAAASEPPISTQSTHQEFEGPNPDPNRDPNQDPPPQPPKPVRTETVETSTNASPTVPAQVHVEHREQTPYQEQPHPILPHPPEPGPRETTPSGHTYTYVDAPSHARTDLGDARTTAWEHRQRELQDTYDTKLGKAVATADDLGVPGGKPDPNGLDPQEARRFGEAFSSWTSGIPKDAGDAFVDAVWQRARGMLTKELAGTEDRDAVFDSLEQTIQTAALRESAVLVGMQRFSRVADAWGRTKADPTFTASVIARTRTHMATVFRGRVESAVEDLYPVPAHTPTESETQQQTETDAARDVQVAALAKLDELSRGLLQDLGLRAKFETAMSDAETESASLRSGNWRTDLSPADAELLAHTGVRDTELSDESIEEISDSLRRRVQNDFEDAYGSTDSVGSAGPQERFAQQLFDARRQSRLDALKHDFAVQAAREHVSTRVLDRVKAAVETWGEDGLKGLPKDVVDALGLSGRDPRRHLTGVTLAAARAVDDLLSAHIDNASRGDEQRSWDEVFEEATGASKLHDLFSLESGRDATEYAAHEQAGAAATTYHDGSLGKDAVNRVQQGFSDRVRTAYADTFTSDADLHDPEKLSRWKASQAELAADLEVHLAFEEEVMPALREASDVFDDLADSHGDLDPAKVAALKRDYGKDWFESYKEQWGPENLDGDRWRSHEASHEDTFKTPSPAEHEDEDEHGDEQDDAHEESNALVPARSSTRDEELRPLEGTVRFGATHRDSAEQDPGPTTSMDEPSDRVDRMFAALTSQGRSGTLYLGRSEDDTQYGPHADVVARFPVDERFFSLAIHTGAHGRPIWDKRLVTAKEFAALLKQLYDAGIWDGGKPLQLPACDIGVGREESYAAAVLRELRPLLPDVALDAYVPEGKLFFAPRVTGPFSVDTDGPGHLVVAESIGLDIFGRQRIVPGGTWLHMKLDTGETQVHIDELGAHLPVDGVLPPRALQAPAGYTTADTDLAKLPMPQEAAIDGSKSLGAEVVQHALYQDPRHKEIAAQFELNLGVSSYADPEAVAAVHFALTTLHSTLIEAHPDLEPDEIAKLFGGTVASSTGQVSVEGMDDFWRLASENSPRSLLTAFMNAFYHDSPLSMAHKIEEIVEDPDEDKALARATALKLDVALVKAQRELVSGPSGENLRAMLGTDTVNGPVPTSVVRSVSFTQDTAKAKQLGLDLTKLKLDENGVWQPDGGAAVKGVGFMTTSARNWRERAKNYLASSSAARKLEPPAQGPYTKRQLADLGAGLTDSEIAFLDKAGAFDLDTPLPWIPHALTTTLDPDSAWAQRQNERGLNHSGGISILAAKAMRAYLLLGGDKPDAFMKTLYGALLPTKESTLSEIVDGAGLNALAKRPSRYSSDSAQLYRHIPGHPLSTLRGNPLLRRTPIEQHYLDLLVDGKLRDAQGTPRREARKTLQDFRDAVHDITTASPVLQEWLSHHAVTPAEVLEQLGFEHFVALAVYTGSGFPLINVVLKYGGIAGRLALKVQARSVVDKYYRDPPEPLPQSISQIPEIADVLARPYVSPDDPEVQARKQEIYAALENALPEIEEEMKAHGHMVLDAMRRLPKAMGTVVRGERGTGLEPTSVLGRLLSSHGGKEFTYASYASFSREPDVAKIFAQKIDRTLVSSKILIEAEASGNLGRDIAPFSLLPWESEVLFLPGAKFTVAERFPADADGLVRITVKEVPADLPVRPEGDMQAALTAHRNLLKALTRIDGSGTDVETPQDLADLAEKIGVTLDRATRQRVAEWFSWDEDAARLGLRVWHVARLAADIRAGADTLTLEDLKGAHALAELAREDAVIGLDDEVTLAHYDSLLSKLPSTGGDESKARNDLLDAAKALQAKGDPVTLDTLERHLRPPAPAPKPAEPTPVRRKPRKVKPRVIDFGDLEPEPEPTTSADLTPLPGAVAFGGLTERVYRDEVYTEVARSFEAKLGGYLHGQAGTVHAAESAVLKLYTVLKDAHPAAPHESEEDYDNRIARVFLKDDPASYGQVGTHEPFARFLAVLDSKNVRMLMTAFSNAAYYRSDKDPLAKLTLKAVLRDIVDTGDWDRAARLGLDVAELRRQAGFLNGPTRSVLDYVTKKAVPSQATMFEKDFFATGTLLAKGAYQVRVTDGADYVTSIRARRGRDPENQPTAPQTVGRYRELGAPPHEMEIAYLLGPEQENPDIDPVLPWKSGGDAYALKDGNKLVRQMQDEGLVMIAGTSATTAKMLNAFMLLGVQDGAAGKALDPIGMLHALEAWMLTPGDHSLAEISEGASLVEHFVATTKFKVPADGKELYRSIPGVSLKSLRGHVSGFEGMLPHESAYHKLVHSPREDGGFGEPAERHKVLAARYHQAFKDVAAGELPKDLSDGLRIQQWLKNNGMTADEVLEKLSLAHFEALAAYTGPASSLFNVVMRSSPATVKTALRQQVKNLLTCKYGNDVPAILSGHPKLKPILAESTAGLSDAAKAQRLRRMYAVVDDGFLTEIETEIQAHTVLVKEALDGIAPASGPVYRGGRAVGTPSGLGTSLSTTYGGPSVNFDHLGSSSRSIQTATGFKDMQRRILGTHQVLLRLGLTGAGTAVDISVFSVNRPEEEVLIKDGSSYRILTRTRHPNPNNPAAEGYELIEAVEKQPDFPWTAGPAHDPLTARRQAEALNRALSRLAGFDEGEDYLAKTRQELWPLAEKIGATHARSAPSQVVDVLQPAAKREAAGLRTWYTGRLASELHGGPDKLTVDLLTDTRRTADVVREALRLGPDDEVGVGDVDRYIRTLKDLGPDAPVDPGDRLRLVKIVKDLKTPGRAVRAAQVASAWRDRPERQDGGSDTVAPTALIAPSSATRQRVLWFGDESDTQLLLPVLDRFPVDDAYLPLAMHTFGGLPMANGDIFDARSMADELLIRYALGEWDEAKKLLFVACGTDDQAMVNYATDVLRILWANGLTKAVGVAAVDKVLFVPKFTAQGEDGGLTADQTAKGHLVVSGKVGFTANGLPAIAHDGNWTEITRPSVQGGEPGLRSLGPYLPVGGKGEPGAVPEHYVTVPQEEVTGELAGAVAFGKQGTKEDGQEQQDEGALAKTVFEALTLKPAAEPVPKPIPKPNPAPIPIPMPIEVRPRIHDGAQWGTQVEVPADNYCTLSGVIVTDPVSVFNTLFNFDRSPEESAALTWLLDPRQVRTEFLGPDGSASGRLEAVRRMLITHLADDFLGNKQIADLPPELRDAMGHGDENAVPAVLNPVSVQELRAAIRDWAAQWSGHNGELFLHVLGHALHRQIRVRNAEAPLDFGGVEHAGPSGELPLHVFRHGHPQHINASAPHGSVVRPAQTEKTRLDPNPKPVPKPAPAPAPAPKQEPKTAPKPLPAPPERITAHGQLSYSDLSKGFLETGEDHVIDDLGAQLEPMLSKSGWKDVRKDLGKLKLSTLAAKLPHLGHGETDTITLESGPLKGRLRYHVRLSEARTLGEVAKVESENGYEHYVASTTSADRMWQYYLNLGGKETTADKSVFTNGLRFGGDNTKGLIITTSPRSYTRGKTVEDHLAVGATVTLTFDFSQVRLDDGRDFTYGGLGGDELAADLHAVVLTPKADSPNSGFKAKDTSHYRPPKAVETTKALTGLALPRDVFLVDGKGSRISGGLTAHEAGRTLFGEHWPAVRDELDGRIDLAWVYTHLNDLTSTKPIDLPFAAAPGGVRIRGLITSLRHERNTDQTEFNLGSHQTGTTTKLEAKGRNGTLAFTWLQKPFGSTPLTGGLGFSAAGARDGSSLHAETSRTGVAVKSKKEGAAFDLGLTLEFAYYRPDKDPLGHPVDLTSVGTTDLGGKVVYPAGLSQKVPEKADALWTPASGPAPQPPPVLDKDGKPVPAKPAWAPPKVPDGTAHLFADTGLPHGSVVFDVIGKDTPIDESPLAGILEAAGSHLLGAKTWGRSKSVAQTGFGKDALEHALPAMTRGTVLRGPKLPDAFKSGWAEPRATARLTKLEYLDSWDSAEAQYTNEHGSGDAWRENTTVTTNKNGSGGGLISFDKNDTLNPAIGGSRIIRSRSGIRVGERSTLVDNVKISEPMALFKAEAEVPVDILTQKRPNGPAAFAPQESATVAFLVLVPKSALADRPPLLAPKAETTPVQVAHGARLRSSDTVTALTRSTILADLETVLGGEEFDEHEFATTLDHFGALFDEDALKPRLPGLTQDSTWGGVFTSGAYTTEVVITRVDPQADSFAFADKVTAEFETGGSSLTTEGVQHDVTKRNVVTFSAAVKSTHVAVNLAHDRSSDESSGRTEDETAEVTGKAKFKTDANRYDASFDVVMKVTVWKNNQGFTRNPHTGLLGSKTVHEDVMATLDGRVVVPTWDLPGKTPDQAKARYVPRIDQDKVLATSDAVLDVWSWQGKGLAPVLERFDASGRLAYGSALKWAAAKRELLGTMTMEQLKQKLPEMMHNQPWALTLKDGTRFEFTSSVERSNWIDDAKESETNVGVSRSKVQGDLVGGSDGEVDGAGGNNSTSLQLTGTTDMSGLAPIYGQIGIGGVRTFTRLETDIVTKTETVGAAVKTKDTTDAEAKTAGASVYDAVGLLHMKIIRPGGTDPVVGRGLSTDGKTAATRRPPKTTFGSAPIGLRYLVEHKDNLLLPKPLDTAAARSANARRAAAPDDYVAVRIPPRGAWDAPGSDWVFQGTSGSGDILNLVEHGGRGTFGKAWSAKLLDGRTRDKAVKQTVAHALLGDPEKLWGKRSVDTGWFWANGGWGRVVGTFDLVSLHFLDTHGKAENVLTRELVGQWDELQSVATLWGASVVGGVKVDPLPHTESYGEFGLTIGVSRQGRNQAGSSEGGRILGNAKTPTGMATYLAAFRGTFAFYRGLLDTHPVTEAGIFPLKVSVPLDQAKEEFTVPRGALGKTYFEREHPTGTIHGARTNKPDAVEEDNAVEDKPAVLTPLTLEIRKPQPLHDISKNTHAENLKTTKAPRVLHKDTTGGKVIGTSRAPWDVEGRTNAVLSFHTVIDPERGPLFRFDGEQTLHTATELITLIRADPERFGDLTKVDGVVLVSCAASVPVKVATPGKEGGQDVVPARLLMDELAKSEDTRGLTLWSVDAHVGAVNHDHADLVVTNTAKGERATWTAMTAQRASADAHSSKLDPPSKADAAFDTSRVTFMADGDSETEVPDELIVPGDGYCLLTATVATDPQAVAAFLAESHLDPEFGTRQELLDWLRDDDLRTQTIEEFEADPDEEEDSANPLTAVNHWMMNALVDHLGRSDEVATIFPGYVPSEEDPLDVRLDRLAETVDNWGTQWASPEAEWFPRLLSHALDRQIEIISREFLDGQVIGTRTQPIARPGRPTITLYHRHGQDTAQHYNGSRPAESPTADADPAASAAKGKQPRSKTAIAHEINEVVTKKWNTQYGGGWQGKGPATVRMRYARSMTDDRTTQTLSHQSFLVFDAMRHIREVNGGGTDAEREMQAMLINNRLLFASNLNESMDLFSDHLDPDDKDMYGSLISMHQSDAGRRKDLAGPDAAEYVGRLDRAYTKTQAAFARQRGFGDVTDSTAQALSRRFGKQVTIVDAADPRMHELLTHPRYEGSVFLVRYAQAKKLVHAEQKLLLALHRSGIKPEEVVGAHAVMGRYRGCLCCTAVLTYYRRALGFTTMDFDPNPGFYYRESLDNVSQHQPHVLRDPRFRDYILELADALPSTPALSRVEPPVDAVDRDGPETIENSAEAARRNYRSPSNSDVEVEDGSDGEKLYTSVPRTYGTTVEPAATRIGEGRPTQSGFRPRTKRIISKPSDREHIARTWKNGTPEEIRAMLRHWTKTEGASANELVEIIHENDEAGRTIEAIKTKVSRTITDRTGHEARNAKMRYQAKARRGNKTPGTGRKKLAGNTWTKGRTMNRTAEDQREDWGALHRAITNDAPFLNDWRAKEAGDDPANGISPTLMSSNLVRVIAGLRTRYTASSMAKLLHVSESSLKRVIRQLPGGAGAQAPADPPHTQDDVEMDEEMGDAEIDDTEVHDVEMDDGQP